MLTYKRVLAASTAVALSVGGGFATNVFAQVAGQAQGQIPGNPPTPVGQGPVAPAPQDIGANFRRDSVVTVMQRPREGYEALGIRAGTLLVFPKLTLAAGHTDNVFASNVNKADDTIWQIQPEVSVNSDWNRHQLAAFARASINRHQDFPAEDTVEWGFGGSGRLDVSRSTQVNANLSFTHATEPRTSPNAQVLPVGTDPVEYDLVAFGLQARHEFNRLLVTGRFDSQDFTYDSPRTAAGTVVDQSYRNRTVNTFGGRVDYAVSPATAIFGEVLVNTHNADHAASNGVNRDSKGSQAHVGVNFEVTNLMRGDIGVGYMRQEFDGVGQKDLEGFSTNASLAWLPTQLTTVTLTANRAIQDSAVPDAAGYLSTDVAARIDHELLRNVILTAQAGYGKDEYTGLVREDRRTTAGIGASYLINRTFGVSANYNYLKQETRKGTGANFEENKVSATLTVQY